MLAFWPRKGTVTWTKLRTHAQFSIVTDPKWKSIPSSGLAQQVAKGKAIMASLSLPFQVSLESSNFKLWHNHIPFYFRWPFLATPSYSNDSLKLHTHVQLSYAPPTHPQAAHSPPLFN